MTCPMSAPRLPRDRRPSWAQPPAGEIRLASAARRRSRRAPTTRSREAFDPITGPMAIRKTIDADHGPAPPPTACPAPPGGFTLLGSPTVIAKLAAAGPDAQVAARLVDVGPAAGTETLVARGLYRPRRREGGLPAPPQRVSSPPATSRSSSCCRRRALLPPLQRAAHDHRLRSRAAPARGREARHRRRGRASARPPGHYRPPGGRPGKEAGQRTRPDEPAASDPEPAPWRDAPAARPSCLEPGCQRGPLRDLLRRGRLRTTPPPAPGCSSTGSRSSRLET